MNKVLFFLVGVFVGLFPTDFFAQPFNISASSTVCVNQSLLATVTGTSAGVVNFVFFCNPPEVIANNSATQVSITFTTCGTHTISCVAFNSLSIPISTVTAISTAICPGLTITPATQIVCPGETATLVAAGANSYTWSNSQNAATITPLPPATTSYSVMGNINGCVATATVNIMLLAIFNSSPFYAVCPGQTIALAAAGGNSYTWTGSSLGNPVFQSNIIVGAGTYTVASAASSSTCINTVVIAQSLPINLTLSQSEYTTCISSNVPKLSKPVTLSASATGSLSYAWFPSNLSIPNQPTITVTPTISTCYTVIATSTNVACTESAVACVSVIPQFTFDVESKLYRFGVYQGSTLCRFEIGSLNVINISTLAIGPVSAFSYSWNLPPSFSASGFSVSGQMTPSLTFMPLNTFTYSPEIADAEGCISAVKHATAYVWICEFWDTALNNFEKENDLFTIYPNPTKDFLSIQSKTEIPNLHIEVSDLLGKTIVTTSLDHKDPDNIFHLDLKELKPGVYFVGIFSEDKIVYRSKVLKE